MVRCSAAIFEHHTVPSNSTNQLTVARSAKRPWSEVGRVAKSVQDRTGQLKFNIDPHG